jgi:hypothetical protein
MSRQALLAVCVLAAVCSSLEFASGDGSDKSLNGDRAVIAHKQIAQLGCQQNCRICRLPNGHDCPTYDAPRNSLCFCNVDGQQVQGHVE